MTDPTNAPQIQRHKAAKRRNKLSSTIRAALLHGIIKPEITHLDYGCGRGNDTETLTAMGYKSIGFDPYYFPDHAKLQAADVVTLSYVLNVIENRKERDHTLAHAYSLAKKILVVSSIIGEKKLEDELVTRYGDGVITKWNTFEKFYGCKELRVYVESVLGVRSQSLGHGILAVPKVEALSSVDIEPTLLLKRLTQERTRLQKKMCIPAGTFLEKYETAGKTYYRLRSPIANLPGKNGLCKCLHLGKEGSDRYQWGCDQLEKLGSLSLLEQRIHTLGQRL